MGHAYRGVIIIIIIEGLSLLQSIQRSMETQTSVSTLARRVGPTDGPRGVFFLGGGYSESGTNGGSLPWESAPAMFYGGAFDVAVI